MNWMVLPYQRYVDFAGRSRRKEYWMFTLLQILLTLVIVLLAFAVSRDDPEAKTTAVYGAVALMLLVSFIPGLAVQVRRFHDQNLSGWLVLLGLIPYLGGLIVLVFMCIDGTRGPNKYGDDPKGSVDPAVFA